MKKRSCGSGSGEMALWGKGLPHKHEDLQEKSGHNGTYIMPELGRAGSGIPDASAHLV